MWRPSRRCAETFVLDSLETLKAVPAKGSVAPPQPAATSEPGGHLIAVAVSLATLLVVAIAAFILGVGRARPPHCEPITYTLQGSPPIYVLAELGVATKEMHQRSGLVFDEGDRDTSKLVVTWSDRGVTSGRSSPVVSGHGTTRTLGFGRGQWTSVPGGHELVAAAIEVDATASWPLGIDRGDGLAAVFAHEFGHVLGLGHSTEPASFMYDHVSRRAPRWTAHDLDQLERAGRQSGCRLPKS